MGTEFKAIALVGRHADARVAEPMQALARHLTAQGCDVYAAATLELELEARRIPEESLCEDADLAIAIGGDGTMLYASRLARDSGTPILGVNRGRLGFLADITPDEMIASVDQVLAGHYQKDSRMMLEARFATAEGETVNAFGLNDVVLQRRGADGMVDFSTYIDGRFVNTHSGDGLIVATPTGSTAYALSCGGPILEPHIDAVALVPVCPHTLTDRPIVVPHSQVIDVSLLRRDNTCAEITVDGVHLGTMRAGDSLRIAAASKGITMLHPPGHDFYGILRSKLYWGRDLRKRADEQES
ncbi:MAG: NAD(+)/NADH kinase [Gammaproteobacteria bacterium]|nr:NAD(+)/NADH kinase [Gammaproteobacteria bacterium]MBT8106153.1 NAD(+)/NADH kinase [Gammaproteobacteria bacterium]NNF48581.1 NAD(+) kinase [Woeseiaceae bacterium]NNK26167.1 NAD(+) kinase [Woeseiaceae bacterium]NNL63453.1 NAD(+) kinase [Woeseiaceae bacterium]